MEPNVSSKRLLNDMRSTALELQKLLLASLTNASSVFYLDSFIDYIPSPALTNSNSITSLTGEIGLLNMGAKESSRSTQYQAIDLWTYESLVQYSILQSACSVAEVVTCDAAAVASSCRGLVIALKKLLNLLSIEDLTKLSGEYFRANEENTMLRAQNGSVGRIVADEMFAQPFRTGGKPKCSDLNRTDVFEIVEKICEQAEDERQILETELRNARYDLDRARESHEVSEKTISYIKTQLESEKRRYSYLEDSSSDIIAVIRDIATELDCFEPASGGLRIAQSLKRQVMGLLSEMELKEKAGALEAARSFINDLGVELKDVKADRARLRGELERKNLLIQKLREEGAEKSIQIDRYRATFDALFEPNTAAKFAKQVAEQYKRYKSKSPIQRTTKSTCSIDAVPTESSQHISSCGERHVPHHPSCQQSSIEVASCAAFTPFPKPLLPTEGPCRDKENFPDDMASRTLHLTQSNLEQRVYFNFGTEQALKKPLNASPMTTDSKRIRLAKESPKALPLRIVSNGWTGQTLLQAKYSHLNHRSQRCTESVPTSKPSSPHPSLSSAEKPDPGCPIS
ncbi:hypothetical protein EGR_01512 [Echinococcus granulosus]|uniref:Uncharacterized protein n=1 Tax=Echinococcus granulosus TaxID=6210 RepID=W6UP13_ECHGR|nr:hypothetical protein EGR_01512 [Echinococcus granulosus]EUB63430.1 hypothetical protein EGR_01512 [Echinococcus granulosus]